VLGDETERASLTDVSSTLGGGTTMLCVSDDCRECAGGVGGRPGAPILLFGLCFNTRGLEVSDVGIDARSESTLAVSGRFGTADIENTPEFRFSRG
jgi:hypothetical protein